MSSKKHASSSNNNLRVLTIASGHFSHDFYTAFLPPLLPIVINKFSLSLTSAGILTSISRIPSLLNPIIGYLADKKGAKYFVIITPALTSTMMCLLGVAPNPYSLAAMIFLAGTSSTIFHASTPGLVAESTGNNTGYGMSLYMAGGGLGRSAGPLLFVWGIAQWGLSGIIKLVFLGWAASIILFILFKDAEISPRKNYSLRSALPTLKSFFFPLILVMLLRNTLTASLYTYLPIFMVQSGAPYWLAGASISSLEIAGVIGALIVGPLSDKFGRRQSINLSMLISAISLPIFLQLTSWYVFPLLLVLGFFSLSTSTLFLALVQDHFESHRATGNSLYILISFLSNAIMLIVIGKIGDYAGLRTAYYISSVAAALSIPAMKLIPKKISKQENYVN